MGNVGSSATESSALEGILAALPDQALHRIHALCAKNDTQLRKPHPDAPPAYPAVSRGVAVTLDTDAAHEALKLVPRLQQKHHEMIPRFVNELAFFVNFFSHFTVIVQEAAPNLLARNGEYTWRGDASDDAGVTAFTNMWSSLGQDEREAIKGLADPLNDALMTFNQSSPQPFPPIAFGMRCFIDTKWCESSLINVPGLQRKFGKLVPGKLDERNFWMNFSTHLTSIVGLVES